jgi:hypothetical protein
MNQPDLDLVIPDWNIPESTRRARLSSEEYLLWLEQNRAELIASGKLEALLADPARTPVNARFSLEEPR